MSHHCPCVIKEKNFDKARKLIKETKQKKEISIFVSEDDELFIMEAMKMEIPVGAPVAGTVKEIKVSGGQSVDSDEVLAVIE